MSPRRWTLTTLPLLLFFVLVYGVAVVSFLRASIYEPARFGELHGAPTLENYETILTDSFYLNSIKDTLQISALTAIIGLVLAYPIAYLIARSSTIWSKTIFVLVVGSLFVNAVVRTLGWTVLLGNNGTINDTLMSLGIINDPLPLSNNLTAVTIGLIHAQLPLLILGLMPVCEGIPANLLQASYGLGASRWQTFWNVIVPMTWKGSVGVAMLIFAATTGVFTTVALLGGGRVATIPILIRQQGLLLLNYPRAATLAVVLVVIVITIVTAALVITRQQTVRSGPSL